MTNRNPEPSFVDDLCMHAWIAAQVSQGKFHEQESGLIGKYEYQWRIATTECIAHIAIKSSAPINDTEDIKQQNFIGLKVTDETNGIGLYASRDIDGSGILKITKQGLIRHISRATEDDIVRTSFVLGSVMNAK